MKSTLVAITGVATEIRATIPAKFVKVEQDGATPNEPLIVNFRQPDGTFSADETFPPGSVLKHIREDGIICMPPGYVGASSPAVGEAYMKVRTGGNAVSVRLFEYENIPRSM